MIDLSPQEKQVITNRNFFFTKATIIKKVQNMFGELQFRLQELAHNNLQLFPPDVLKSQYKISKGENYKGLPYVVLDYPAFYSKEDIFAFRAMFWWGNHLSFSFHLQGNSWEIYKNKILENTENLLNSGLYLCIHKSPWEYYFEQDNSISLENLKEEAFTKIVNTSPFFKIASKTELEQLKEFPEKTVKDFIKLLEFIR